MKQFPFFAAAFGLFIAVLGAAAAAAQEGSVPTAAPNYLSDLPTKHKWRKLPVHVFFQTGGSYSPAREQAVRAGFDEWSRATNGVIGYTLVSTQKQADVIVRFVPSGFVPPDPKAVGVTAYSTHGSYLYKALMTLATGGQSRPAEITEVAAHEWGHALGIHGHSQTESDLMYGVTTRYLSLNPDFVPPPPRTVGTRDLNTLKAIYAPLFRH